MQCGRLPLWRCSCSALFETSDGLRDHLQPIHKRIKAIEAERQSWLDHFAVTPLSDQRIEGNLPPIADHFCPKCDQTFTNRRDLRKHYRTHVSCFEVCVYCHRIFACRATDFLAHQHKEPTATAASAAATAITKDEDEEDYKDKEDYDDDVRDAESKKVYMAVRRALVLSKVERSLKRAGMKRKRPTPGDFFDPAQRKRPLLVGDLLDKADSSDTDDIDVAPQPETGAAEPAPRVDASPPPRTENSGHGQPLMMSSGRDSAVPSSSAYMSELSTNVLPGDMKGFHAAGETSFEMYVTDSSTAALSGHGMAVLNEQLLAGTGLDVASDRLVGEEAVSRLLQELPDVHEQFNYGWEDHFPQTRIEGAFRQA